MPVYGVEVERVEVPAEESDQLTLTLRGRPKDIIATLTNGLSIEQLKQLRDALDAELTRIRNQD